MSRETLERLKAQIAEQHRIHGENARDSMHLRGTALPVIERQIVADALAEDDLAALLPMWPQWEPGLSATVGRVFAWNGALYEVIQAHTTQADWEPQMVPALFKLHAPTGFMLPWVMPTGSHDAPNLDDERTHNEKCWRSLMNGNTSEPSDTAQWWEEISC